MLPWILVRHGKFVPRKMLGDEAEDVDESAESEEEESGACDYWDDLAECRDGPGCVLLWCARCGNRPRGAHDFRCRLHDDTLSNGHTRPTPPSPPSDEAAEIGRAHV